MLSRDRTMATAADADAPPEPGFRWVLLAASWTIFAVAAGLVFFALPVYMAALGADPGIPIGSMSGATSFFYVALAGAGLPVGWLLTRVDVRWIMSIGSVIGVTGFVVMGQVDSLWQVYVAYGLLGSSFASLTFIPLSTLVFRWFVRQRGLATTLLMSAQAVGGATVTPLASSLIQDRGLPATVLTLAMVYVAVICALVLLFIRPGPSSTAERADTAITVTSAPVTLGRLEGALAPSPFALVCVAMSLVPCAAIGVMTHLYTLGGQRDIAGKESMVPLLAIASGAGTFIALPLLRRWSAIALTALIAALQAGAVLLLAVAFSTAAFATGTLTLGLSLGAFLVLMPLVLLDLYPAAQYPRRYALLTMFVNLGVAAGPGALGLLRSMMTEYRIPLLAIALAPTVAAALLTRMARRQARAAEEPVLKRPSCHDNSR